MIPGDAIAVKIHPRRGPERELKWKVSSSEETSYELKEIESATAAQRAQRAAWLNGEAQINRQHNGAAK